MAMAWQDVLEEFEQVPEEDLVIRPIEEMALGLGPTAFPVATVAEPVTRVKDASSVANAMPGLRVRRHRRGRGQFDDVFDPTLLRAPVAKMGCTKSKAADIFPLFSLGRALAFPEETMGVPASHKVSLKNQRTAMVWDSETDTAVASATLEATSEVHDAEPLDRPAELTPIECEEEVPQDQLIWGGDTARDFRHWVWALGLKLASPNLPKLRTKHLPSAMGCKGSKAAKVEVPHPAVEEGKVPDLAVTEAETSVPPLTEDSSPVTDALKIEEAAPASSIFCCSMTQ
eukprot:g19057.t1